MSKVGAGESHQVRVLPPLIPPPPYSHLLLLSHGSGSPACLPAQNSGRCRPSLRPHLMAPGGKDLQTHIPLKPAAGWSRRPCHNGGSDKARNLCPGQAWHGPTLPRPGTQFMPRLPCHDAGEPSAQFCSSHPATSLVTLAPPPPSPPPPLPAHWEEQ